MLRPQSLVRHPDLHVGREVPTAQVPLAGMCFDVDSGDQRDSASGIPSASKVALALNRYLRGLVLQARVLERCTWCLGKPEAVGKDPQDLGGRWGCCRLGQASSEVAVATGFRPPGRWAMGGAETFHCHLGWGLSPQLPPRQSLSPLSHVGCTLSGLHYCQCLPAEGRPPKQV